MKRRTVKWWQIEDTDFCYFEIYEGRKVVWSGITGLKCVDKLIAKENERWEK